VGEEGRRTCNVKRGFSWQETYPVLYNQPCKPVGVFRTFNVTRSTFNESLFMLVSGGAVNPGGTAVAGSFAGSGRNAGAAAGSARMHPGIIAGV
jgi:hypothetical protein